MKTSENQKQTTVDSIINRQQKKEYQRWRTRSRSYYKQTITKKKMHTDEYNIQELLDTTKRPNLRIHRVEEGSEMQIKGTRILLDEIIA
jgi:beta-N-acetylglucosaminidase